jgi:hypothetical protein
MDLKGAGFEGMEGSSWDRMLSERPNVINTVMNFRTL